MLSPGKTTATFPQNIPQYCWPSICQIRPNDSNIWTQHVTSLLAITCCGTWKRYNCDLLLYIVGYWKANKGASNLAKRLQLYNIMQHPQMLHKKIDHFQISAINTKNMLQYAATRPDKMALEMCTTCCDQQNLWGYVVLKCWDHLARALALKIFE